MKERTKQILLSFLKSNNYLSVTDLCQEYAISQRTLRNEIAAINQYLLAENLPEIKRQRGKGLILQVSAEIKATLLSELAQQCTHEYFSKEERFVKLIFAIADTREKTFIYQQEEKLGVSKSTLDEDMRSIRHFLTSYKIEVKSFQKEGVVFSGDERSIRTMLYNIVSTYTTVEEQIGKQQFHQQESVLNQIVLAKLEVPRIEEVTKAFQEVVSQETIQLEINHVYRNQLILFTTIWLFRLASGNTLQETTRVKASLKSGNIRHFIDLVCQRCCVHPALNELKYIVFILESFNRKHIHNSLDWVAAQMLTIQLIDSVEQATGMPFSKEEDLFEGLYKHMTGLLSRMKNDVQIFNPLKETIQTTYQDIYQAVASFASQIEELVKKELSEDELSFLTIYFSTSESRIHQEVEEYFQAVVICNHGISTGKLLAARLKEAFNIEVLAVLSTHDIDVIKKLDVDFVFTTVGIDYLEKPTLLLHPILTTGDQQLIQEFLIIHQGKKRRNQKKLDGTLLLQDILTLFQASDGMVKKETYHALEQLFKEHQLMINQREIQPMLQDLLNEEDVMLQVTCQDWQDSIRQVAQPLVRKGAVEERYINAMIQSVEDYGPYIVIGKYLALAHARPEDGVNELGVSVLTLAEPIAFGHEDNDPVKIIFCLAAKDAYSHLNVMKHLIGLIHNQEKVATLTTLNDPQAFLALLLEQNQ